MKISPYTMAALMIMLATTAIPTPTQADIGMCELAGPAEDTCLAAERHADEIKWRAENAMENCIGQGDDPVENLCGLWWGYEDCLDLSACTVPPYMQNLLATILRCIDPPEGGGPAAGPTKHWATLLNRLKNR